MPKLAGFPPTSIPGPPPSRLLGPFPRLIRFLDDPIASLEQLRAYGDVVAVSRDNPALVCVFGPERNREVLSNPASFRHDEEFLTGAPGTAMGRMSHVIVNINGETHKRHRRLMMPAFAKSALARYALDIVDIAERLVASWPVGEVIELDARLRDLAVAVAIRNLFGLEQTSGQNDLGYLAREFVDALANPLAVVLPYDVPGLPYHRAQRLGAKVIVELERLIAQKRAGKADDSDALSLLLHAVDEDGSRFNDEELLSESMTLFFAGHDTMAKTMTWTLFLLERHPDILAAVLAELDRVVGERPVTVADLPALELLDRVIKESMRILPSVPMLFLRVLADDLPLGPLRLPKHANVVVSPFATHRDPELYPAPRRFDPDRFIALKPNLYTYLPFGAGPRACVGAIFAQQAVRLMLATILRRVRLSVVGGANISRLTRANILRPRHGLPVRVHPPSRARLPVAAITGDIGEIVELAPA